MNLHEVITMLVDIGGAADRWTALKITQCLPNDECVAFLLLDV